MARSTRKDKATRAKPALKKGGQYGYSPDEKKGKEKKEKADPATQGNRTKEKKGTKKRVWQLAEIRALK